MGGNRRKKRQGDPQPLPEAHFNHLKRKAGLPVADPPAKTPFTKRRRTAAKPEPQKAEDDDLAWTDEEDDDSLLDSGEDFEGEGAAPIFSDDDEASDWEEKLTAANFERLSKKLDQQLEQEKTEAEAELRELQTNIDGDGPQILDNGKESLVAPDMQSLRMRITDTIRVLEDFANRAEEGRSRAEYTSQLLKDICSYYGVCVSPAHHPPPRETGINMSAVQRVPRREALQPLPSERSIRLFRSQRNTPSGGDSRQYAAHQPAGPLPRHWYVCPPPPFPCCSGVGKLLTPLVAAQINRGVTLEPVGKWSNVGLQIFQTSVPLGATPEYLAGHYILQAAASFLPVMALAPEENERVLDMAAAPGGKTTYMAALMKNTGVLVANDANKARAKGLIANIHRLGAKNTVVCCYDAREFPRVMGGFDRVLLDAPCSGTGVISKDPSVKSNKTEKDFMVLPHTQKYGFLPSYRCSFFFCPHPCSDRTCGTNTSRLTRLGV